MISYEIKKGWIRVIKEMITDPGKIKRSNPESTERYKDTKGNQLVLVPYPTLVKVPVETGLKDNFLVKEEDILMKITLDEDN